MAGRDPYGVLHAALAGTGADRLPYGRANGGDRQARHQIASFYSAFVLPRLERLVATGSGPQIEPPGSQFGLRSPFPQPARPSRVEVAAAQDDLHTIREFLLANLRARQGLAKPPLWGAMPGSLEDALNYARGVPNA